MRPPTQHRLGRLLAWGLVAVLVTGCSTSKPSQMSAKSDHVQANLAGADELWFPDLDADGEADVVMLTGREVRFAVSRNGAYLDVVDEDGDAVVVTVSDGLTVTCQSEGAFVQTFERPTGDVATGPLRLYRLDIDGSIGVLTPNPSFFFGADFELPDLGVGCPTSR